jgi:multidrug resistance efflux pump
MSKWIVLLVLIAAGAGWAVHRHYMAPRETTLTTFGTLEARNIEVGSKEGGRITEVLVHEGDVVRAGQTLVVFDDAELAARVLQAQGRVDWARANVAKMEHGSRPEEIAEAQAAASDDAMARGFRSDELAQARAELERTRAEAINAERQYRRAQELSGTGAVSKEFVDDAEAKRAAALATARSAEHAVAAAEGRLKAAAAVTTRTEAGFRQEDLDAARGELTRAEGELKEAEARLDEHQLRAPADAIVEVLDRRPGDLVAPNAIVAKLLETNELYAMVYVPETRIGEVHIGQAAELHVDSYPGLVFRATVEQIRQQAEFLPRNVQTREERVHQVIGVKLRIEDPEHRLRAGISVEVRFPKVAV